MTYTVPRRKQRFAVLALFLAPALFIALSVVRGWRMAEGIGTYVGCRDCFWLATFGHDAWLLAAMLALLAVANALRRRWLGAIAGLLAALILLVFAFDVALDSLLSQRLHFGDVLRFAGDAGADLSVLRATLLSPLGIWRLCFILLTVAVAIGVGAGARHRPRVARLFAIAAAVSAAFSAYALSRPVRYVNDTYLDNVIEANLPRGRTRSFSMPFIAARKTQAEALPRTCAQGSGVFDGSVIVLMVESLSSWQSHLLGGNADWMPQLDAIARDNHYLTHFYANGFTTSGGLISVIAGRPPIPPAGSVFYTYDDFPPGDGSLADIAHRSGREAAFFTSGDLGFLDVGAWLHTLGFDVVDGSSSPFYHGMQRWQFGAAADAALYDRFLDWMAKRDAGRPFVSVLLTVSTHPPYVDPRTGRIDPENSFRYADAEIGRFYRELRANGFLEHGVLLVFGDHRTMTPLHPQEYRRYGDRAFARVPLVIAGAVDMPAMVDAPFQQTDIQPSIADLMGGRPCTSPFAGLLLRPVPAPPEYIVHARGNDRDRVDVYRGVDETAGFNLDGDGSTWAGTPARDAAAVAAWIDVQRVRAALPSPPRPTTPPH